MKEQTIPLVGSLTNRTAVALSYSTYDQRFENCFPEVTKNPITGAGVAYLVKRLGFDATNNAGASYLGLSGSTVWTGHSSGTRAVFAYLNSTTLAIYDSTFTIVGATISNITGSPRISETRIGTDSYLTLIATKSATSRPGYWYLKEGDASWTEVDAAVDADYPANTPALTTVGSMVHMDGFAFIMDSKGQIWSSALNSLTSWSTVDFLNAQSSPDGGSGVNKSKNYILGFGSASLDFFQNTGNATGSPLSRVPGASRSIGCRPAGLNNCETHKAIGDSVYFIGQHAGTGVWRVFKATGTDVQEISNAAINKELTHGASIDNHRGIAGAMSMYGMQHVVLYTGATYAPVYCIDTNTWWYLRLGGNQAVEAFAAFDGKTYFTVSSNGSNEGRKLWRSLPVLVNFYDNVSTPFTLLIQTMPLDQGTNRKKFYHAAEILADHRSTSAETSISWSDNDYQNFSAARTIDLSTGTRRITRLGSTQRNYNNKRAWKITETAADNFRAESLKLWYTEGTT